MLLTQKITSLGSQNYQMDRSQILLITELMAPARQNVHKCYAPCSLESLYNVIILIFYFTLLYIVVKNDSVFTSLLKTLLQQIFVCVFCSACDICGDIAGLSNCFRKHSKETTHTLSEPFYLSPQLYGLTLEIVYTTSISFLIYFTFLHVTVKNASIFVYLPNSPMCQYIYKGHAHSTLKSLCNAIILCLYLTLLYVVVKNASLFISLLQQLFVCVFCSSCDVGGAYSSLSKYLKKHGGKMSRILSGLFYPFSRISILAVNTIDVLETLYATSISFSIYFTFLCVVVKNASFCVYLTSLLLCEFSTVLCSTNCDVCADVTALNGCLKRHSKETLCVLSKLFHSPTQLSSSKPIFLEMQVLINFGCLNWIGREFFYTPIDDVSYTLSNENIIFYGIFTEKTILLKKHSLMYEWIVDIIHNHSKCLHCSYLSWMSRRRAEEDAERRMKDGRRTYVQPGDDNTVPAPPTHEWGSRGSYNKEKLCSLVTGVPPNPSRRIGRDRVEMDRFLDAVRKYEGEVPIITGAPNDSFNPLGVPLLDYIKIDSYREDGWSYPSVDYLTTLQRKRQLSWAMRKEIEVKEIVIGKTSNEEAEKIISWAWSCYRRDQDIFPTSTLSFDVEEVKMTYLDFLTIGGARDTEDVEVVISNKVSTEVCLGVRDSWYQFPCRLMFGNGSSWSLQVRIPVEDRVVVLQGKKTYQKVVPVKPEVQPAVIRFLETSPTLVGVGIRSDVTGTEECYSMIYGKKVVLPKYVEIGTLATVLGWGMGSTNMPTIALITTGLILNKTVSEGDKSWGNSWDKISPSLRIYAAGDLKMGHESYLVLAACALRDFFPDKEAVCLLGKTAEFPYIDWFLKFLKESLAGLELQNNTGLGDSRPDRICSIRYRTVSRGVSAAPPTRVVVLQDLLGGWPAVTKGGPRYLHQVRLVLQRQFEMLKGVPGAQEEAFFASVPFPAATLKTLFFARSDLAAVDWRIPDEEARLGLVLHSDLEGTVLELDPENLLQQEGVFTLTRLVTAKPMRERLQEWIRLRPERWRQLVRLMELQPQYVPVFQEIYEHLRLTYLRATGRFDGTIASIEDDILQRNIVMQRTLENAVEAAEAELRMRQRRLEEFHALKDQGVYINRKGWQHVITPTTSRPVNYIPRDRPMNVPKRKRVRGEETRANKRPRLDLLEELRKQAILAPTTINRPDVDPEVPLEKGEHHSCGKVVGAPTAQRMAREALAEHRYRLVVYMSTDEDDDDSHITLGPAPNVIKEGKMGAGVTAVRGRIVCLDDNTMVTMSDPVDPPVPDPVDPPAPDPVDLSVPDQDEPDVDLEIGICPADEQF